MTTDVDDDLNVPVRPLPPSRSVAVIAEHDLADVAYLAFVERLGYRAVIVDVDAGNPLPVPAPAVVIVRSVDRLNRFLATRASATAQIIGIGIRDLRVTGIRLPDSPGAVGALQHALAAIIGPDQEAPQRVHLSSRECEVVVTYVLGATVRETSSRHFIAPSTVRTHLRRVMDRYVDAGRPVNNKSQLLIELIADGWVDRARLRAW
ncbi:response regulator transcription factor [Gordonia desulfuricans]|uniref:Response regulator transcription factor n=1 Tax=Gordonia desulfuricans TaxID=89051 RepID=A0A7K3LR62_9ACTN|nr:LuxR C-terminal-related transcriptional regulator [Gordonia desulfuricans]NDK90754.1 response regulator transcription factor [Gordonia desulfuricans]